VQRKLHLFYMSRSIQVRHRQKILKMKQEKAEDRAAVVFAKALLSGDKQVSCNSCIFREGIMFDKFYDTKNEESWVIPKAGIEPIMVDANRGYSKKVNMVRGRDWDYPHYVCVCKINIKKRCFQTPLPKEGFCGHFKPKEIIIR